METHVFCAFYVFWVRIVKLIEIRVFYVFLRVLGENRESGPKSVFSVRFTCFGRES